MRALAACALALCACEGVLPAPDLERMKHPNEVRAYAFDPLAPDGRAMRLPPEGVVPRDRVLGEPTPPALSRALLLRGRASFEIVCAACHGLAGDGQSPVARNMELRRPPSLMSEQIRAFSDERIYRVIAWGYGLMPAYAHALSDEDRWAAIAYLRALQLSQAVRLDALPAPVRAEALQAIGGAR